MRKKVLHNDQTIDVREHFAGSTTNADARSVSSN